MKKKSAILAAIVIAILATQAFAQSTDFNYQGSIQNGGSPANGSHDFEFALFDAASGGSQVGPTVTVNSVTVVNGQFSVNLNFGNQFPGADRYLEIRVRQTGGPSYTTLAPRQKLASVPYSTRSNTSGTADNSLQLGGLGAGSYLTTTGDGSGLTNLNASNFSSGTVPVLRGGTGLSNSGPAGSFLRSNGTVWVSSPLLAADLPTGSGNYIQNTASLQSGAFSITGTGSASTINATLQFNLNGSRILDNTTTSLYLGIGSGTNNTGIQNTFLGVNAGNLNTTSSNNTFIGYNAGTVNTATLNTFVGSLAGSANTTGTQNTFLGVTAGLSNTTGNFNTFVGRNAGRLNIEGLDNSFFGDDAGTNSDASQNSFFGSFSGTNTTTGGDNSFFGYRSGDANVTGSQNTTLGTLADVLQNNLVNATAIGYRAAVNQNNSLILGSINGVNGAGTDTRVGIGTTAPTFRLHIRAGSQDGIKIQNNGNGDFQQIRWTDVNDVFKAAISVGPAGSEDMRFFVNGSDRMIIENTGTVVITNLGVGGLTNLCRNPSNQISTCSSSARYKTNINGFTPGLDLVRRLRPVSFNWKDGGVLDFGLVAEEVAAVEPLLTINNEKGQVEGVKYDRIGVILVNAVNEQQQQIETQERKISEQQKEINRLRAELDALKRLVCAANPSAEPCRTGN